MVDILTSVTSSLSLRKILFISSLFQLQSMWYSIYLTRRRSMSTTCLNMIRLGATSLRLLYPNHNGTTSINLVRKCGIHWKMFRKYSFVFLLLTKRPHKIEPHPTLLLPTPSIPPHTAVEFQWLEVWYLIIPSMEQICINMFLSIPLFRREAKLIWQTYLTCNCIHLFKLTFLRGMSNT